MMARILSTVSYPVWSSIIIKRNPFFRLHQHHRQQKGSSIRNLLSQRDSYLMAIEGWSVTVIEKEANRAATELGVSLETEGTSPIYLVRNLGGWLLFY